LAFDLWSSDMSLVDVNATYVGDEDNGKKGLAAKNKYNSSDSSTSSPTNNSFNSTFQYYNTDKGNATSDIVNIGSISLTMSFGDLTKIYSDIAIYPVDGTFGVSASYSRNNLPNTLQQLLPKLENPYVTFHLNRTRRDYSTWPITTDAEILFGSQGLSECASNWSTIALSQPPKSRGTFPSANVTSISITDQSARDGPCNNALPQVNHTLFVVDYFTAYAVSYQAMEVFKKASGATYNDTYGWFTVDCSTIDSLPSVSIGLSDGNTLVLTGRDYILHWSEDWAGSYYRACSLYAYGYYDEDTHNNRWRARPFVLGQRWLNNHCISYNIKDNTLSYTDALPNNGN